MQISINTNVYGPMLLALRGVVGIKFAEKRVTQDLNGPTILGEPFLV